MNRLMSALLSVFMLFTSGILNAGEVYETRDEIPLEYQWDLTALYESNEEWQAEKEKLAGTIDKFETYKGRLDESADVLFECLDYTSDVIKTYYRLSSYASRLSDQDTRESGPQARRQTIGQLGTKLSAATSFMEPEILAIDEKKIDTFFKEKEELQEYAHYIDDIRRMKAHTLSKEEEKIISEAGIMSGTPYDIYSIFKNADMPRPEITVDEKTIRLDDAAYTLHRASKNRDKRIKVFEAFFGAYKDFERTMGTELYSQIKKDMFYKNVRNYESSLEAALKPNNVPVSVYHGLIESVHKNLPVLHRYLELRKKMLGLDELHYYDMYPSLVEKVEMTYSVEEAQDVIKLALNPLGADYVNVLNQAFSNRWIDMFPNTGKRSGAYSAGSAYDVHPYILMNYMGKYDDVSTLAHELGHTMHSYYSNQNQTFINSHYPIFLAEVASITNENLLVHHVLNKLDDPEKRLSILGSQLETFRTTLFRQTQFAEFELKIHELAEKGEALTGEKLSQMYLDILKTYYGHDEGVTVIDDLYAIEWAYIPHFYYNFYVFQYATSLCAATAVAEKILDEGKPMSEAYVNKFLSAGGSEYPIPILKRIGVDMTTTEPFDLAIKKMNEIMDEIEKILENQ